MAWGCCLFIFKVSYDLQFYNKFSAPRTPFFIITIAIEVLDGYERLLIENILL